MLCHQGILLLTITGICAGAKKGKLQDKFSWTTLDYTFASDTEKEDAIEYKHFIPENNIPTGIAVSDDKIFVSIPRRKSGIPATLAYFDKHSNDQSPKLIAYPTLNDNTLTGNCKNIISVNRGMRFDNCGRLWVFDYGKIGTGKDAKQICPPRIHIFDMKTNNKVRIYTLKHTDYEADSIFTSASIEIGQTCNDHFYYITDQKSLIVYSWKENDSWRFKHPFFWVDPIATDYTFNDKNFQWNDAGVFATAVSPVLQDGSRNIYFHSLSSYNEFAVSNKILHNKKKVKDNYHDFMLIGSRENLGRSTTEVFDREGVLFFNLIDKNAVACWKSGTPYKVGEQIAIVAQDDDTLVFPSASVIDSNQDIWILSNKLPSLMYGKFNTSEVNFIILSAAVKDLKVGTPCNV